MNSKKNLIKNKILSGKGHKTDNNNNEPPVKKVKKSK